MNAKQEGWLPGDYEPPDIGQMLVPDELTVSLEAAELELEAALLADQGAGIRLDEDHGTDRYEQRERRPSVKDLDLVLQL